MTDPAILAQILDLAQRLQPTPSAAPEPPDTIIGTAQVAALLGVGQQEVRALVRGGQLPCWPVGGKYKFSHQQVLIVFRERAAANLRATEAAD